MSGDLLSGLAAPQRALGEDAMLLPGFAAPSSADLLAALAPVLEAAPFRHMVTPGGHRMSVAMTSAGTLGWVTDRSGYRYDPRDPETGRTWPPMPGPFTTLATNAATEAGFPGFAPDSCLINRYTPGTQLSLHQDRNERDFSEPIVSVSLGLPATFLWGGATRATAPNPHPTRTRRRRRLGPNVTTHVPWHRTAQGRHPSPHRRLPDQPHLPPRRLRKAKGTLSPGTPPRAEHLEPFRLVAAEGRFGFARFAQIQTAPQRPPKRIGFQGPQALAGFQGTEPPGLASLGSGRG